MSLPQYDLCNTHVGGNCSEIPYRCDLCVVDTINRDEQLILDECLKTKDNSQRVNPDKLVDWSLQAGAFAPNPIINKGCYNIANKYIEDTRCGNGGIYDIYTQTCICAPGYVGEFCQDTSETCIGITCTTSKNSREFNCDSSTCRESIVSVPPSKPFTLKDILILLVILFILSLPLIWVGLLKVGSPTNTRKITTSKK